LIYCQNVIAGNLYVWRVVIKVSRLISKANQRCDELTMLKRSKEISVENIFTERTLKICFYLAQLLIAY